MSRSQHDIKNAANDITSKAVETGLTVMALGMMATSMQSKTVYTKQMIGEVMSMCEKAVTTSLATFASELQRELQKKDPASGDPAKFDEIMAKFGGIDSAAGG
jgi:hypothetical protein